MIQTRENVYHGFYFWDNTKFCIKNRRWASISLIIYTFMNALGCPISSSILFHWLLLGKEVWKFMGQTNMINDFNRLFRKQRVGKCVIGRFFRVYHFPSWDRGTQKTGSVDISPAGIGPQIFLWKTQWGSLVVGGIHSSGDVMVNRQRGLQFIFI